MDKISPYSLIVLFLLSTLSLFGQRVTPKSANSLSIFELIPVVNQGYVSVFINDKSSTINLTFTGGSETIESTKEISLQQRGLTAQLESAFLWDNQLVLLTSLFYPGPQRDLLLMRRYSLPDFKEVDSELVAEAYVPGRLRIPFGYALSPDSTKIMCYSWTFTAPEDSVKMEVQVLDKKLKRIWNEEFEVPNKNENFYIYSCKVDNDANAYLLCEDYQGKPGSNVRINDERIERFILHLNPDTKKAIPFPIELSAENTITSLQMTVDELGNLIGGGFYKEANKFNQTGLFAYRIDHQTQAYQKWEIPISREDYLNMHPYASMTGKFISGTRQLRGFQLDYLVWDKNKGLTLIGEQRLFESEEDKFNDVLVLQLDPAFKKKWGIRIPKRQSAEWLAEEFTSYQFLRRGDKNYVIFNDHESNMPINTVLPKKIKELHMIGNWSTRSILHLVRINDDGQLQHQNLDLAIPGASPQMRLIPGFTRSDRNNVFLLYLKMLSVPNEMGKVFPISWVRKKQE